MIRIQPAMRKVGARELDDEHHRTLLFEHTDGTLWPVIVPAWAAEQIEGLRPRCHLCDAFHAPYLECLTAIDAAKGGAS